MQLQAPALSAVAVHSTLKPSTTLTVLPASAAPLKVGVLSLVALAATGISIAGALGAVVSTVKVQPADGTPVLPATSLAVATTV